MSNVIRNGSTLAVIKILSPNVFQIVRQIRLVENKPLTQLKIFHLPKSIDNC